MADPFDEALKKYQSAGGGQGSSPDYGSDVTVADPLPSQIGKGALREGAQLLSGAYGLGRGALNLIPGVENSSFGKAMQANQDKLNVWAQPQNMGEAMGKTGAEMASYLAPAKLETAATEAAPQALRGIARVGTGALSNGLMSKMNGGDFTPGAITGGGMGLAGELGRGVIAPALMRSAIPGNISKDSANAVLAETRGVRPSTVLGNTETRIGQAGRDLDRSIAAANQRPTPRIAGFLMPPVEEIPLASSPDVEGRLSQPIRLTQTDRQGLPMLPSPSLSTPMAPGMQHEFPSRLASGDTSIRPFEAIPHPGMGQAQYIGQIPGERGGVGTPQGTLLRRPEMSASIPPATEPNSIISMQAARRPIQEALGNARSMEAGGLHNQLSDVMDYLRTGRVTGQPIPETVPPVQALHLRRGLNEEYLGNRDWKKTVNDRATAATKQAYGGLTSELHAKVPGSVEADDLMSKLIPARNGLRTLERNDPSIATNVMGRVGARTGALTGMAMGGAAGARSGGLPGAIAGGMTGLIAPEVMSAPAAKMAMARAAYSTATPKIARAVMTPAVQSAINYIRQRGTGGQE